MIRTLFSAIGFLFVLLFTVRGIYQVAFTIANHANDIGALLSGSSAGQGEHWSAILAALKQSPSPVFDVILLILCSLIMIHGVFGIYYAISTDYNVTKMFKEKALLYLQILSAFGAVFVIMALTMPSGKTATHSVIFWILGCLIAVLGSFHIANGFFNACITLGISVSPKTKLIVKILSWIIAVFSMLQIIVLLI